SPARTCFKQRCRVASQRSASPNQNALSLALRALAARRRHSLALRRKRSVLVILASWTTPAALLQRQSIDPFWPECERHRESLWQVTPESWGQILACPQTICRCELICLCWHNRCSLPHRPSPYTRKRFGSLLFALPDRASSPQHANTLLPFFES